MKPIFTIFLTVLITVCLSANNIDVSNVVLGDRNFGNTERTVTFDVSWENSWRVSGPPNNHDAAWVFLKFHLGDGVWRHATLSGGASGMPALTEVDITDDGTGAFVFSAGDTIGDILHESVAITWDLVADGVGPNDLVTVELFAIEMVYVPEGAFSLGSGAGNLTEFYATPAINPLNPLSALSRDPYAVTSEDGIRMGGLVGNLNFVGATLTGTLFGDLPAAYPKGFGGFYCMKYETSQQQYVRFFNRQSDYHRGLLDISGLGILCDDLSLFRNGFCWDGEGDATTDYPYVPISYLSPAQIGAYLDWAGLRPMTELEYEKACRGTGTPVMDEYAWGTSDLNTTGYSVSNQNATNEVAANSDDLPETDGNGLCLENGLEVSLTPLHGPIRIGGFAASGTRYTRITSGGSYYGIMELSGNLGELVVTVTDPLGWAFSGDHGDGVLGESGLADILNWPLSGSGYGSRGGGFSSPGTLMRVSDRTLSTINYTVSEVQGFRGVRTFSK